VARSVGRGWPAPAPHNWSWAALMRRAFALDVLACPRCGARLRVAATIEDPVAVRRILTSVVCHVPPRLSARVRPLRFPPRPTELISPRGTETPRPAAEPGLRHLVLPGSVRGPRGRAVEGVLPDAELADVGRRPSAAGGGAGPGARAPTARRGANPRPRAGGRVVTGRRGTSGLPERPRDEKRCDAMDDTHAAPPRLTSRFEEATM
jgi:hypothetical protein